MRYEQECVRGGILLVTLLTVSCLLGCFGLQLAAGCINPGIFGCEDKGPEPSEIAQSPTDLKRALRGGRTQQVPVRDGRYMEGQEDPWSRLLDDCMAAGATRTECFASLPPDILAQFEAWEAKTAAERRRQFQQRSRQQPFAVESVTAINRDETECLPEQRGAVSCIEIYQPVCAIVKVLCIATPCDPVRETFENSCEACMNSSVSAYTEGACPVDQ